MAVNKPKLPGDLGREVTIQREVRVAPEVMNLLKAMGVPLPDSVKEIQTEVVTKDDLQQILIPKSMSKMEAAKELELQWKNEEQIINSVKTFHGWNWKDVLVAIKRTTEETFGWIKGRHTMWTTPTEIDITVGLDEGGKPIVEKAFLNAFSINPWENAQGNVHVYKGEVTVTINSKKKYANEITQYFNFVTQKLETASIYRGRNIVVTNTGDGGVDFEIIENRPNDIIVLNRNTSLVLDNFVTGELENDGKRTFLFTGTYGNGKTEVAMQIGRDAVGRGLSFFYVKDSSIFEQLLIQSKKYQPCIIFLEDIDEIGSGEERDKRMNVILNSLDGVQTKGHALTTIFTTNHPERINSALRRPGRIDLVVEFNNPDKLSRKIIMEKYFMSLKGAGELDYEGLAAELPDAQGAVIAEICKRSVKLAKKQGGITDDVVLACLESIKFQMSLMEQMPDTESDYVIFFKLLGKFTTGTLFEDLKMKKVRTDVSKIRKGLESAGVIQN